MSEHVEKATSLKQTDLSDGQANVVKKRSLSSYLSNMNSRKEELERLAKREVKLANTQRSQSEERQSEEAASSERDAAVCKQDQEPKSARASAKSSETGQSPATDTLSATHQPLDTSRSPSTGQLPIGGHKLVKEKFAALDEFSVTDKLPAKGELPATDQSVHGQAVEKEYEALSQRLTMDDGLPKDNGRTSLSRSSLKGMLENLTEQEKREGDDEDSELSEVDSNVSTEPASPLRPRRGRLIRGDQLVAGLPRGFSPVVQDGDSDSELSDVDDLRQNISSSILHVDSSPERLQRTAQASSPRELVRQRQDARNPSRKHISMRRRNKPKKTVQRDAGGRTKLQIACDKGNYEMAQELIAAGYDVNDQDNAGNSSLHEAALNGHLKVVQLLIEHGADINIQSFSSVRDTPLIDASANGHLDVVKLLLEHGANPTITNAKGLTAIESIDEDSDLDQNERQVVNRIKQELRSAAREFGQDFDKNFRSSPDLGASKASSPNVSAEDAFVWTDITSKGGRDKLLRASKEGRLTYVGSFLENGGKIDVKSFFEAVRYGHEDIVSLFLAFGARANSSDKTGQTPLMVSVGRGHRGTVALLLEAGADPAKVDKRGRTALDYAQESELGIVSSEEIQMIKTALNSTILPKSISDHHEEAFPRDSPRKQTPQEINRKKRVHSPPVSPNKRIHGLAESVSISDVKKSNSVISPNYSLTEMNQPALAHNVEVKTEKSQSPLSQLQTEGLTNTTDERFSITPKVVETPKERELRQKAEEQYRQRRLASKLKKEQELLQKLAMDEQERSRELAKLKKEEREKAEKEKLVERERQEKLKNQAEIERRRALRAQYPLGLRLIDFNDDSGNIERYLPLFCVETEGKRCVLDLHLCILVKDPFLINTLKFERQVSESEKRQLWNIYKFIFLSGGRDDSAKLRVDLSRVPLKEKLDIEEKEADKFCSLKLHWVPWDASLIHDVIVRQRVKASLIGLFLASDASFKTSLEYHQTHPNESQHLQRLSLQLPLHLRLRPKVSQFMQSPQVFW
ncbi:LAMI_0C07866g1_1 [Lachancea mirantina]|uniref:LAMI_0C07866g1_1 n=1 Tax=Lachancea mirantina TaxID=1230905 RepID=A0A1G4J458_9SACH|nr:LAMI_0C07866g1_1 [Lachancea mirantina]